MDMYLSGGHMICGIGRRADISGMGRHLICRESEYAAVDAGKKPDAGKLIYRGKLTA